MRIHRRFLIAAAALGAASAPAGATTSTTNMTVGITITAACNISVTNINFGSMLSTALLSAQTSTPAMGGLFTYTCSPGSNTPSLAYGNGTNYSGGNRMIGDDQRRLPSLYPRDAGDRYFYWQRANRPDHRDHPRAGDASGRGRVFGYGRSDVELLAAGAICRLRLRRQRF